MRRYVLGVILLLTFSGCGEGGKAQVLTLDQVPKDMMATAKEKLPEVTFDQAIKKGNGVIEVRGKDTKGKVRDIEFSPSGEVVEVE